MPPEVPHFRPSLIPLIQFSPSPTTRAQENQPSVHKHCQGNRRMNINIKKLIPILVLILSIISILRLLRLTITTSSSSSGLSTLPPAKVALHTPGSSKQPTQPPSIANLTEKEFKVLSTLIAQRRPCNLLIFGFQPQYLILSLMNAAGNTVFLEDDPDKISASRIKTNATRIYKVEYNMPAKGAYKLLKHARQNPACAPNPGLLQNSKCKLALKNLPAEVYEKNWDVMVVDGPRGDSPEAQGRMASIYTASVLARAGHSSDIVVHDADRMIEKWFSWEFLCDENLFYSKGKLWHFKISGHLNVTRFCTAGVQTAEQWQSSHYRL